MSNENEQFPAHKSSQAATAGMPQGRVWFVGAGPGAADLLTIRAAKLLESADAVLYDILVPPQVLGTLRPEVERIPVRRDDPSTGARYVDPGAAVGELLVTLANQGKQVVRLKGGDPAVFARFSEEVLPLKREGVAFAVVPGVTAATAAAAALVTPLTSRAAASSVTLITGHRAIPSADSPAGRASANDFAVLATLPGTVVIYMGLEQINSWTASLLEAGCPGTRPVAVVSRCGWPDERRCLTTLAELRDNQTVRSWPSPAVILVGDVLTPALESGADRAPDEPEKPLAGQQVLVTRPAAQASELLEQLSGAGAHGCCVPVVEIVPPDSWEPLDRAIQEASTFDWIVFSSSNGVEAFSSRLAVAGDARLLGTARLAAVGPRTAEALAAKHMACDLVPTTHSAAGLVEAFADEAPGRRFLLIQADRGRDTLSTELTAKQHEVHRVTGYISRDLPSLSEDDARLLTRQPIDWIILSSPAITANAVRLFGERLRGWKIACNSAASAELLASHGLQATVVSDSPAMPAVIQAMQSWETAAQAANIGQHD